MIPEPTTAASSIPVPTSSATNLLPSSRGGGGVANDIFYEQQVGPQQACGLAARTKALIKLSVYPWSTFFPDAAIAPVLSQGFMLSVFPQ
jgi:hypothetical protein